MKPPIEYAKSGDVHVAYQVVGDGPVDLVVVHGWAFGFEHMWTEPTARRFLEQLASRYRVILFDKRGTGLSDLSPTEIFRTWRRGWTMCGR